MANVAEKLGVSSVDLDESIYADLLDEQHLIDFKEPSPVELLQLYNFALASVILAYSVHIQISYSGRSDLVEKAASSLGEVDARVSGLRIDLKPLKQVGVRGKKFEALLGSLMVLKDWSLHAEVAYPPRYQETRPLELNWRNNDGMFKVESVEPDIVIEIKAPVRKGSFGDPIVIEDVANRLGLTDKELLKKIEAENVKYIRLPGVLITQDRLNNLRTSLREVEGADLATFKSVLKGQGCKNPIPVLEALGYIIEIDPETHKTWVSHLKRGASS